MQWLVSVSSPFLNTTGPAATKNKALASKTVRRYSKKLSCFIGLNQRCPTLSPFATRGDRGLKCVDRHVSQNLSLLMKTLRFSIIMTKVATTIVFFATIVENVATKALVGHFFSKSLSIFPLFFLLNNHYWLKK